MGALPRMLLAVLAGYALVVVVALGGVEVAGRLFPHPAGASPTLFLSISIAVGFLGSVAAGYVSTRLAPAGLVLVTIALFILLCLATTVVMTRFSIAQEAQRFGLLPLVTLLGVVGAWTGAMIERAIRG